jgi:hypothetical protein
MHNAEKIVQEPLIAKYRKQKYQKMLKRLAFRL